MGKVIGSLDLIGNPAAIISDISGGVRTFIREPQRGALRSPTALGVVRGGSLSSHGLFPLHRASRSALEMRYLGPSKSLT